MFHFKRLNSVCGLCSPGNTELQLCQEEQVLQEENNSLKKRRSCRSVYDKKEEQGSTFDCWLVLSERLVKCLGSIFDINVMVRNVKKGVEGYGR